MPLVTCNVARAQPPAVLAFEFLTREVHRVKNHTAHSVWNATNITGAPSLARKGSCHAFCTQKTCSMVDAPYVEEAYAVLECVHLETKTMMDQFGEPTGAIMVLGEVVGVHISDDALTDGFFDSTIVKPLARMGYMEYTVADKPFSLDRP